MRYTKLNEPRERLLSLQMAQLRNKPRIFKPIYMRRKNERKKIR